MSRNAIKMLVVVTPALVAGACGATQKKAGTSPSVAPSAISTAADTKIPDAGSTDGG